MNEKIRCACVRCKLKESSSFIYSEGFNHDSCYSYLNMAYEMYPRVNPDKYDVEEGFFLSNGDFVDRLLAMEIAKSANQLMPEYKNKNYPLLYSYMLDLRTLK